MITSKSLLMLHNVLMGMMPSAEVAIGRNYRVEVHELLSVVEVALAHRDGALRTRARTNDDQSA